MPKKAKKFSKYGKRLVIIVLALMADYLCNYWVDINAEGRDTLYMKAYDTDINFHNAVNYFMSYENISETFNKHKNKFSEMVLFLETANLELDNKSRLIYRKDFKRNKYFYYRQEIPGELEEKVAKKGDDIYEAIKDFF